MNRHRKIVGALLIASLVCGVLFLAARRRDADRVSAAGLPSGNGDINADGALDLSDAIGLLLHLFQGGDPPVPIVCADPAPPITVLVVRHAEKESGAGDVCLTVEGKARAEKLRVALERVRIGAVFATDLCRTLETVKPAADEHGLVVTRIDDAKTEDLVTALGALAPGTVALVAGHSYTIPGLMTALGIPNPVSIGGEVYDNLWVVGYDGAGPLPTSLLNMKY